MPRVQNNNALCSAFCKWVMSLKLDSNLDICRKMQTFPLSEWSYVWTPKPFEALEKAYTHVTCFFPVPARNETNERTNEKDRADKFNPNKSATLPFTKFYDTDCFIYKLSSHTHFKSLLFLVHLSVCSFSRSMVAPSMSHEYMAKQKRVMCLE